MKKVLDASIIAKWFSDEKGSKQALEYLNDFAQKKFALVVPTLLFYELGSVFLKKKMDVEDITKIMKIFQSYPENCLIQENIGHDAFRKIYQAAKEYNLSYYDATYVVLMQKHNCEFVTSDNKLYQKIKGSLEKVSLL